MIKSLKISIYCLRVISIFPKTLDNKYEYIFENLTENTNFQIIAEDWISDEYEINVYNKPSIYRLVANVMYPNYTKIANEQFVNIFHIAFHVELKFCFHLM